MVKSCGLLSLPQRLYLVPNLGWVLLDLKEKKYLGRGMQSKQMSTVVAQCTANNFYFTCDKKKPRLSGNQTQATRCMSRVF